MGQPENLDPSSSHLQWGPSGVQLIYGIPISAQETRLIGEYLYAQGLTVSALLLHSRTATVDTEWEAITARIHEFIQLCTRSG